MTEMTESRTSWHRVTGDDVPDEGRVRSTVVDGRPVALTRCDGLIGALENRCPVGPSGLGWLEPDLAVQTVSLLGLAMLLFLAGLEVDARALRGALLPLAAAGYALSLLVGWGIGAALEGLGWLDDALLVGVALSATSLGLVVAVLKDARLLETPVARTVVASASFADFAAVLLLSVLFSTDGGSGGARVGLFLLFGLAVAAVAMLVAASGRRMRVADVVVRLQDSTAEIRVRAAVLLMVALAVFAEHLGLESILGAFLAGAAVGAIDRDQSTHPQFRVKLDAVGYGFLIPVFFVASGLRLDVSGLVDDPAQLLRLPVYVVALLLARGVPALLFLRTFGRRETVAAALLQATSLPFLVAATQIGVITGRIPGTTATALVCAGLVSVLVFPAVAVANLGGSRPPGVPEEVPQRA
ncbi:cation:proton antiporter [Nocardioides panacisoli]|uniref:Cation:proton antiporter n=2 Tax=Nocardioides panacisoli TaxID=627624 RepID=A0ABP7ITX0_9ACTN